MKNQILDTPNWDRRYRLCKQFGMRAAIVYAGTRPNGMRMLACDHRLRVKTWANHKLGPPCHRTWHQQYSNTDSQWYQGYNTQGEYVIAFRDLRIRDWALLL